MQVAILMGSKSDLEVMTPAVDTLAELGISYATRILSAHRTPNELVEFIHYAEEKGCKAFICGAGVAAHLAGVVAAHTDLPVIAVPISASSLGGFDALLAMVQMPPGVPVATMAVGGSLNAALFAAQIISVTDAQLQDEIASFKSKRAQKVLTHNYEIMNQEYLNPAE